MHAAHDDPGSAGGRADCPGELVAAAGGGGHDADPDEVGVCEVGHDAGVVGDGAADVFVVDCDVVSALFQDGAEDYGAHKRPLADIVFEDRVGAASRLDHADALDVVVHG